MGLDGKTWEPDARPGRSAPLSAMSYDTVGLCGNCDKHGGPESRPNYEAVKQSHVGTSRAII